MKKSEFVKYHASQGIVLLIAWIIVSVASNILFIIPVLGILAAAILEVLLLVLLIFGIVHALNEQKKPLPVIGHLAKNFKF